MKAKQHILAEGTSMRNQLDTLLYDLFDAILQIDDFEQKFSKKNGPQYKHMPNGIKFALRTVAETLDDQLAEIDDVLETIDETEAA